ncbi:MAG: hypothetical protein PHC50_07865 [Candidatus Cloacimonetes bacterium]|nr:hypothetical protein [Candidatus Cloacimonadota bacterium]
MPAPSQGGHLQDGSAGLRSLSAYYCGDFIGTLYHFIYLIVYFLALAENEYLSPKTQYQIQGVIGQAKSYVDVAACRRKVDVAACRMKVAVAACRRKVDVASCRLSSQGGRSQVAGLRSWISCFVVLLLACLVLSA